MGSVSEEIQTDNRYVDDHIAGNFREVAISLFS